jgi:hypothetical protein
MAGCLTRRLGVMPSGPAAGTILVGNQGVRTANTNANPSGFSFGSAFQAVASGPANTMVLLGPDTGGGLSTNHRLVIYAATSQTVWNGAKLGETAVSATTPTALQLKQYALLAPVTIVSGNWYALCIHPDGQVPTSGNGNSDQRAFADAYADGSAATAGASFLNSTTAFVIYATT